MVRESIVATSSTVSINENSKRGESEFTLGIQQQMMNMSMSSASVVDMSMTSKKPKFTNKMGQVKALQEEVIKVISGQQVTLKWKISNISNKKSWMVQPHIKNFSSVNFLITEANGT